MMVWLLRLPLECTLLPPASATFKAQITYLYENIHILFICKTHRNECASALYRSINVISPIIFGESKHVQYKGKLYKLLNTSIIAGLGIYMCMLGIAH